MNSNRGLLGGIGLIAFNTMLSKVEPSKIGSMIMIMILFQISIPAIYQMVQDGQLSIRKVIGIAGALTAAYLLS